MSYSTPTKYDGRAVLLAVAELLVFYAKQFAARTHVVCCRIIGAWSDTAG